MEQRIKVYAKAQNRKALGIVRAYATLHPEVTLDSLRQAFPNSLTPDKGPKENFIDAADKGAYADFDGYFRGDDEAVPLAGGRRALMVSMWTKTSLANIVAKAAEYGIVVAEEAAPVRADFTGKGFSLEHMDGGPKPGGKSKTSVIVVIAIVAALAVAAAVAFSLRGKSADNSKEVESRDAGLAEKDRLLQEQREELERQASQLREQEAQLKAKEEAMAKLKNSITQALTGFGADELTVEHREGKVHVLLEEKLLFASGKYDVGQKGADAIRKIASVLGNVGDDIDIAVEGHTDNVPLRGQIVEDNWDLSAKRATSVMRILIAGGVSPERLHAVGRADTAPVADNATAEGRARNRRTEIVLSPKVGKILEAL